MDVATPAQSPTTLVRVPQITIGVGLVLAFAVGACVTAYHLVGEPWRLTLIFLAISSATAGQLAAAFYAARVLELTATYQLEATREATRVRDLSIEREKKAAAAQFAARWNDATMFYVRQHCQSVVEAGGDQKAVRDIIDGSKDSKVNVNHVINFLEEIALGIDLGLCDDKTAKKFFCGIVMNLWESVDFYVRERRVHRGRPQIWSGLESLYDKWKL